MTGPPKLTEAATFWRYISSSLDRLVTLALEIDDDGLRWRPLAPETNSIAVLAVHTLGNAEENILETLCGQPIGRDRAGEFASYDVTKDAIRARWHDLRPRLETALTQLPASALDAEKMHPRRGPLRGRDILIIVARHSAEHLGQAELTRDLWHAARR